MSKNLEPCPFCKSIALTVITSPGSSKAHIACQCGARGPEASDSIAFSQDYDVAAIREWNIYARARTLSNTSEGGKGE